MKVVGAHLLDIHIYKIVAQRDTHNSSFRDFCQVSSGTAGPRLTLAFLLVGCGEMTSDLSLFTDLKLI